MKTYIATALATIGGGRLRLTPAQAKARAHNLAPTDEVGIYRIVNAVQFKRGEQFGYDGSFPKGMATVAMTPEEIKAAEAAKAKEEKKAKAEAEAAAKKKAAKKPAGDNAEMEQAIAAADSAVAAVRHALKELGNSSDPVLAQAIEDTIDTMSGFAENGMTVNLNAAIDTLVEQTGQLTKK